MSKAAFIIVKSCFSIFKNQLRRRWPPALREWLVFAFLGGYLVLGYEFFFWALRFVHSFPVVGDLLLDRLLHFFFLILWFMLIFSNAVIAYPTQYRSGETSFLFTLPISPRIIFYKQLLEGTVWSSWAFLFLAFPFIIAFGTALQSPFMYDILGFASLLLFVFSAAVLGSFLTYLTLKINKQKKNTLLIGSLFVFFILLLTYLLKFPSELEGEADYQILAFLKKFLDGLSFSRSPYLPSSWVARGLISASIGNIKESLFFLTLLASTALILGDLAYAFSGKHYARAWEKAQGGRGTSTQSLFSKVLHKFKMSSWIRKDILYLFRDSSQWIQLAVLASMMILYTTNLKNIQAYVDHPYWRNTIYFLNLAAIGLMLGTLCLRFVFPQFSLEWRKDWLTGLVPEKPSEFFRVKSLFPYLLFTFLGQGMNLVSNVILESSIPRIFLSSLTLLVITLGLVWLSLGLGTLYPNFNTDNPSKIMSGLGGILALIGSMTYLIIMLVPVSFPFHWVALGQSKISTAFFIEVASAMLFDIFFTMGIVWVLLQKSKNRIIQQSL